MPTVRLTRAGVVETEVPLSQLDVRVGRGSDNDVTLQDPDKTLSRHHAELRREGDRWVYLDLNSANGSWMGETRVSRQDLTPGVSIALGDYFLTLVDDVRPAADSSHDVNATRVVAAPDTTLRPGAAVAPAPVRASAPAGAVVGGAVSRGAAPPPQRPASPPIFRRIIIFGSIAVFGAFAIMLVALFMPDAEPPASEPVAAATTAVPAAPAPAPATVAAAAPAPATVSNVPPPVAPPVAPSPVPPIAPAPVTPPVQPASRAAARPATPRPVAQARPVRDSDPDASAIPARAGEAPPDLQQRRDDLRRRYALALQRLSSRQFVEARELLAGVASEAPGFRDLTARLAEADAGMRQQAAEGFKAAAALEASAEWSEALRAYERLRPLAGALPALGDATERTRKRMHEAGVEALTRARQYDSRGRVPEAIAWYQRAVNWLPADHAGLEAARLRLAQLVNRP